MTGHSSTVSDIATAGPFPHSAGYYLVSRHRDLGPGNWIAGHANSNGGRMETMVLDDTYLRFLYVATTTLHMENRLFPGHSRLIKPQIFSISIAIVPEIHTYIWPYKIVLRAKQVFISHPLESDSFVQRNGKGIYGRMSRHPHARRFTPLDEKRKVSSTLPAVSNTRLII